MCNKNNNKLHKVMLITTIIGLVVTTMFVIIIDMGYLELLLWHWAYYPIELLIVAYGFKWKFGKQTRWIATLCFSPILIELLVGIIVNPTFLINFMSWYSMVGITISVLIFEYKFLTHDNK